MPRTEKYFSLERFRRMSFSDKKVDFNMERGEHNIHRYLKNNQKGTRKYSRFGCAARLRLSLQLPLIIFHCTREKQSLLQATELHFTLATVEFIWAPETPRHYEKDRNVRYRGESIISIAIWRTTKKAPEDIPDLDVLRDSAFFNKHVFSAKNALSLLLVKQIFRILQKFNWQIWIEHMGPEICGNMCVV